MNEISCRLRVFATIAMTCWTIVLMSPNADANSFALLSKWNSSHHKQSCDSLGCTGLMCDEQPNCYCDSAPCCCDSSSCDATGCFNWNDSGSCLDGWVPRTTTCLPIMKEAAESRGATLPLPFGVSIISTVLQRHVVVSDLRIGLAGGSQVPIDRVSIAPFDVQAVSQIARFDAWLLPCFNLYGIAGHTNSRGTVDVEIERFPTPISPPISFPVRVNLDGFTYGIGATAAIGSKDYFFALDANYSYTDFTAIANELFALVITPRLGMVIDHACFQGEVHIGAMYQDTEQRVELIVDAPILGELDVSVLQKEPKRWNFLVGTLWAIDERVHLVCELGAGDRKYVISGLTVRL